MSYYDLSKEERKSLKEEIEKHMIYDIGNNDYSYIIKYSSNSDTYIRKIVCQAAGKLYRATPEAGTDIISMLNVQFGNKDEKVRQTAINALGEIGKNDFESIVELLEKAFNDDHYSVLNAVTGSLKKNWGK